MKKFPQLKTTLCLAFMLATAVSVLIVGYVALNLLGRNLTNDIKNKNLLIARSLASEIQTLLEEPKATLAELAEILENETATASALFPSVVKHSDTLEMILLIDAEGRVAHVTPSNRNYSGIDMSNRRFFRRTRETGAPFWSSTFISIHTGKPTLTLSLPFRRGALVGYLNLDRLNGISDRVNIGDSGYALVVDREGTLIAHPDRSLVAEQVNIRDNPAIAQGLAGKEGTVKADHRGKDQFYSVAFVHDPGWAVGVVQPVSEALKPVAKGRRIILAGAGLALLIGAFLALGVAGRIVRPIVLLAAHTKKIAGGDYASPIAGCGYQEMEKLAGHFRQMIDAVKSREEALRNALGEKEVLLREIHHRVKNNMQTIASLLRMHARKIDDARLTEIVNDCRDRIAAMSLVHESLYQSDSLAKIDFETYLNKLCRNLGRAYHAGGKGVSVSVDRCDVGLNLDQGVAVGLVVSELISNAFKHAFHEKESGSVAINVKNIDDDRVEMIVADDGAGLPADLDIRKTSSLGLRLVGGIITREMGGTIDVENDNGAKFIIRFKIKTE